MNPNQYGLILFMGFLSLCGTAAYFLHVDISVVVDFVSKILMSLNGVK